MSLVGILVASAVGIVLMTGMGSVLVTQSKQTQNIDKKIKRDWVRMRMQLEIDKLARNSPNPRPAWACQRVAQKITDDYQVTSITDYRISDGRDTAYLHVRLKTNLNDYFRIPVSLNQCCEMYINPPNPNAQIINPYPNRCAEVTPLTTNTDDLQRRIEELEKKQPVVLFESSNARGHLCRSFVTNVTLSKNLDDFEMIGIITRRGFGSGYSTFDQWFFKPNDFRYIASRPAGQKYVRILANYGITIFKMTNKRLGCFTWGSGLYLKKVIGYKY